MPAVIAFLRKRGLPLFLLLLVPLFFMDLTLSHNEKLDHALWNLGHIFYFALAIVALRHRLDIRTWPHWLTISIAVFVISVFVEYAQYTVGRSQSWEDIERNLIGAWLGIFWLNRGSPQIWTGRVIATGLLLAQLATVYQEGMTTYRLSQRLPSISDFEHDYEVSWWQGNVERDESRSRRGQHSLKVLLTTATYSGAALTRLPSDWAGYRTLRFEVYNPNLVPLRLTLRINDRAHAGNNFAFSDRYNQTFIAEFGWNPVEVPLQQVREAPANRAMNLAQIDRLEIFATELEKPREFYLDALRLE